VVKRALALAIAGFVTACTSFDDPAVVLDLRVLAMTASPPEYVVDVDLEAPDPNAILAQLGMVEITALVADPGADRFLRWSMTLCRYRSNRCDPDLPQIELGAGLIDDPDRSLSPEIPRAHLLPAAHGHVVLALVRAALEDNPVEALGGIQLTVELVIGDENDPSSDVYAAKHIRLSPRIPAERRANQNPRINRVNAARANGEPLELRQRARCVELDALGLEIPTARPGERITLYPEEHADARESYVVPTLDGGSAMLEETLTYRWLTTHGSWSDNVTGGGRDLLGNEALLGSDWIAPRNITEPVLASLWVVQRDERFGVSWFETCIRVDP
jgi:hypothetical protein